MKKKRKRAAVAESNKKSRTTMMLPHDVMTEVCSWLPIKSLLRFKCVSKSWHDLVSDSSFAKLHFQRSILKEKIVFYRNDSLYSLDYKKSEKFERVNYTRLKSCVGVLASCNGLLLCKCHTHTYIWNPCTGDRRRVKCPEKGFGVVGFGVNSNEYEIVMARKTKLYCTQVYVQSLYTKSWRTISEQPYYMDSECGVCLDGCLHWIASTAIGKMIITFHIGGERFIEEPLPVSVSVVGDFKIIEFQGTLGVACGECSRNSFELWVMKECLWIKLFTVEFARPRSSFFTKDGLILMPGCEQNDHSNLILYDPKNKSRRKIGGAQGQDSLWVQSYAESIVRVNVDQDV